MVQPRICSRFDISVHLWDTIPEHTDWEKERQGSLEGAYVPKQIPHRLPSDAINGDRNRGRELRARGAVSERTGLRINRGLESTQLPSAKHSAAVANEGIWETPVSPRLV